MVGGVQEKFSLARSGFLATYPPVMLIGMIVAVAFLSTGVIAFAYLRNG